MAKKILAVLLVCQVVVVALSIVTGVFFLKEKDKGEVKINEKIKYDYVIYNNNDFKVFDETKTLGYSKLSGKDYELFKKLPQDEIKHLIFTSNIMDSLNLNNTYNVVLLLIVAVAAVVVSASKKLTFRYWLIVALFANLIYARPEVDLITVGASIIISTGICYLFKEVITNKKSFMIGIISYEILNEVRNLIYGIFEIDQMIINLFLIASLLFLLKIYKKHEDEVELKA